MLNDLANTDTLFNKLLRLSFLQRSIVLVLFVILGWGYVLAQIWQQYEQINQIHIELAHQQRDLQHQQQILSSLKQHIVQPVLTPILAAQVAKINQAIQQLSDNLVLESTQWTFQPFPQLTIQFKSYFVNFQQFLTALLTQYPELRSCTLQLVKAVEAENASVQGYILLQLQQIED